jgi:hypothetical protein
MAAVKMPEDCVSQARDTMRRTRQRQPLYLQMRGAPQDRNAGNCKLGEQAKPFYFWGWPA